MTKAKATRNTLIQRLKDPKDDAAWEDFYLFYWELITGWAKRAGCNQSRAQDVFQETMICLLRRMQSFKYDSSKGSFRGYLKSIVNSRVKDIYRKESRYVAASAHPDGETKIEEALAENASSSQPDDNIWIQSIISQALRQTYEKIDRNTYKSFCLYVLDGFPVEEVSRKLEDTKPGTIYQQKSRVMKILEKDFFKLLDDFEETSDAIHRSDRSYFVSCMEEMIKNRPDYRQTIINGTPTKNKLELLTLTRDTMNLAPKLERKEGEFLLVAVMDDRTSAQWIELKDSLSVGKDKDCDFCYDADEMSGLHAVFSHNGESFTVKDQNSANGTFVNAQKITSEKILLDGDAIQFPCGLFMIFNKIG